MADVPYSTHGVFAHEGEKLVFRWLLERKADGMFAVVHTEFHDPFSDPHKTLEEVVTPVQKLDLTTDDEIGLEFRPTIQEAIEFSRASMSAYSKWMSNVTY